MKFKTMILLGVLLLCQIVVMPDSAYCNEMTSLEFHQRAHKVHIQQHRQHNRSRSISFLVSGYVEDNILVLSFSIPLKSTQMRVINSETGITVFEGAAFGTSLSIPLERDSENFEVYIN